MALACGNECFYCGAPDEAVELYPFGPADAGICRDCVVALPERRAEHARSSAALREQCATPLPPGVYDPFAVHGVH